MLNKEGIRELAYVVKIDQVMSHPNADRLDIAKVGGWNCIVGKGDFVTGQLAVYFEIDSKLPEEEPFTKINFLVSKHYKIKSQKIRGVVSDGLLVPITEFGWTEEDHPTGTFVTGELKVTYNEPLDNYRKSSNKQQKYARMGAKHPKLFKTKPIRWLMQREWGRKLLFTFFGKSKGPDTSWPDGKFEGVKRTDQERCENMPWILTDKTPFIVTNKCDGSSGTFILERLKKGKYEFYVCSRNVRMLNEEQECYYNNKNYYWETAKKYDIKAKMVDWMEKNPDAKFVCWQGEICAPGIQGNPQHLTETHFFCFHWTDSINGRRDIRDAAADWKAYDMEVVPIVGEIVLPDDFEEFKLSADGKYDPSACEGNGNCDREGFVYYKTTDPNFSFKNVSREYLLKR